MIYYGYAYSSNAYRIFINRLPEENPALERTSTSLLSFFYGKYIKKFFNLNLFINIFKICKYIKNFYRRILFISQSRVFTERLFHSLSKRATHMSLPPSDDKMYKKSAGFLSFFFINPFYKHLDGNVQGAEKYL